MPAPDLETWYSEHRKSHAIHTAECLGDAFIAGFLFGIEDPAANVVLAQEQYAQAVREHSERNGANP